MPDSVNIEIAGVSFTVTCRDAIILDDLDQPYIPFRTHCKDPSDESVKVRLELGGLPDTTHLKKIFDSEQSWSIFSDEHGYVLVLSPRHVGSDAIWAARFDRELAEVIVYCGESLVDNRGGQRTVSNPFRYPLDQIILMYVLAERGGILLHAAGVRIINEGFVFPGRSGAGKSTLSLQFSGRTGTKVLSDDRIIVRRIGGDFRMFGTPWPGDAGDALNESAHLSGIFFISHGAVNSIRKMEEKEEVVGRFLPVASVPWYDPEMITKALDFCDDLISCVPAYELSFGLDGEATEILGEFSLRHRQEV